jgi:hypothetical protein
MLISGGCFTIDGLCCEYLASLDIRNGFRSDWIGIQVVVITLDQLF